MMSLRHCACFAIIALVGCGGTENPGGGEASGGGVGVSESALRIAHVVPEKSVLSSQEWGSLAVDAAIGASNLSQSSSIRTFGTLTEVNGGWRYEATPTDRLVVRGTQGGGEIVFNQIQGSFSNADDFFFGNHHFNASVAVDGHGQLQIDSMRSGQNRSASIAGTVVFDGVSTNVNLQLQGVETFENDSSGTEYHANHVIKGTLENNDGVSAEIDEASQFQLVAGRGEGSYVASTSIKTSNTKVFVGSDSFQFENAETQKAFRNGKPTEVDSYWQGRGIVTKNGTKWGEVKFVPIIIDAETGGWAKFVVSTATGDIELESYKAH